MNTNAIAIRKEYWLATCAASAHQDVRNYLNGVHVDTKRGVIEATNGHRLVQAPLTPADSISENLQDVRWIIATNRSRSPVKLTAKDTTVRVERLSDTHVVVYGDVSQQKTIVELVDGKFPDCDRVKTDTHPSNASPAIAFDSAYIADIQKALRAENVRLSYNAKHPANSPIRVEFASFPDVHMTLMPCRW